MEFEIKVRAEEKKDFETTYEVVKEAFASAEHADGTEQDLVVRLRKSSNAVEGLSLVAVIEQTVIGHIMFTKATIEGEGASHETLALAPLAVVPVFQGLGVARMLVEEGLKVAKVKNFKHVIVLGSEKIYPKFGFEEAAKYGIKAPFEVPSPNFMVKELVEGGLDGIHGIVAYDSAFMG